MEDRLRATVTVSNVGAGHNVPTGSWTKHVIVGVWARQGSRWLPLAAGPRARVQDADPQEALAAGDWRNPPGFILGVRPKGTEGKRFSTPFLGLHWSRDAIVDTRLAPRASREETFEFDVGPDTADVHVEVRVIHRRGAFGAGLESVPWEVRARDPLPQVLWKRVVR